jgi:hypothetical protein
MSEDRVRIAEHVRSALLEAALVAFEDAEIRGLCCDGAWEAAVSAMRLMDLHGVVGPDAADTVEPASGHTNRSS